MEGGRTFDIDAFLEFMPAQEGEAQEKEGKSVKNTICRFCPSPPHPHPRRRKSLPSEKIFFLITAPTVMTFFLHAHSCLMRTCLMLTSLSGNE
jgi:hypothetical protein